ncbi:MAG: polyribonucleotide nucleotidyltransferase [Bdellovibrionales bacterium]|nr:polyribonucleotide nucleotidyltransferase [Bdellovibrionales bacterium]
MKKISVDLKIGQVNVTLETGIMAKQADGAVIVKSGNNVVLVTAVSSKKPSSMGFFPLTVEYQEKFYSTGKIPGGYFKREGRPTAEATLTCRLIDRPLRPCFPEGYQNETQVIATVLSYDGQYPVESLAGIGASAAFHISDIPFNGPIGELVIGRVNGQFVANPNRNELENSDIHMVVAANREGIVMVEGETDFVQEADVLAALKFAHESMKPVFDAQDQLRELTGNKTRREFTPYQPDADFMQKARSYFESKIKAAQSIKEKMERYAAYDVAKSEGKEALLADVADEEREGRAKDLEIAFEELKYTLARQMILKDKVRIDGRDTKSVRRIDTEVAMLPRAHGSALFTRGETQVLGVVTLGTPDDEQKIDALHGTETKPFMLHYNFPPFCVGETGRVGGQSRREVGHGFLAERALKAVIPSKEDFPYTVRIVSEVLESNGSSSMGTVCSGCMALLDAGVPIKGNVAGIAMGLIKEGDDYAVLSDILGDEDHLGDMDFKVAGTRDGITSLQMDIKIASLPIQIMEEAMEQAHQGRLHILGEMEKTISQPRGSVSEFAPRIHTLKVKPDKVREVIGAGGKVIKGIIEETGVKINIEDDGTINIASADPEACQKAIQMINDIVAEAEVGKTYKGKVVKITDFGAFVEVLPNTSGLLHISEIAHERVRNVSDVLKEGEVVDVKVLDVDRAGRIKLSRKALLEQPEKSH